MTFLLTPFTTRKQIVSPPRPPKSRVECEIDDAIFSLAQIGSDRDRERRAFAFHLARATEAHQRISELDLCAEAQQARLDHFDRQALRCDLAALVALAAAEPPQNDLTLETAEDAGGQGERVPGPLLSETDGVA